MRKTILVLAAVLLLPALLTGCGSELNRDNFSKVENGMTEEEVVAILGEPTDTSSLQLGGLSGTSAVWEDDQTRITIQFINNKVKVKQFTRSEDSPVEQ